ncbi:hypothetical protein FFI89_026120 [Bradyrhizobium sp. KBS0727]|uniref:hypothetical protein n=1 Tax=unclassified Bradyrhizobium TaxID=2631580 RepID=UPI00110E3CCD|nr:MULTISPECIES: hypothetical protein [unclassified Bradyrhizobium]QDW40298.1 hypothetical protein FFI71_026125 [Bradyrhizobium sp. KBS0725]QDW46901.1 hypothetical protein FFI89_026120 [Bradyrhizobium sp. KBS0727]
MKLKPGRRTATKDSNAKNEQRLLFLYLAVGAIRQSRSASHFAGLCAGCITGVQAARGHPFRVSEVTRSEVPEVTGT